MAASSTRRRSSCRTRSEADLRRFGRAARRHFISELLNQGTSMRARFQKAADREVPAPLAATEKASQKARTDKQLPLSRPADETVKHSARMSWREAKL